MDLNFEEALTKLEEMVQKLESGDLSLEATLETFEEGMQLSQLCAKKLDEAEMRVRKLIAAEDGGFEVDAFDAPLEEPT